MEENYIKIPQPNEISDREREDGLGSYLMMFAALAIGFPLPIINLIASIVYYYVNRKKSRFIHFHCLQSLLSQIPTTIINWGVLFWTLNVIFSENYAFGSAFITYLIFAFVANILYFSFSIYAAIKAKKGIMYYFVFFGPLAYKRVFHKNNKLVYKNEGAVLNEEVNKTPF